MDALYHSRSVSSVSLLFKSNKLNAMSKATIEVQGVTIAVLNRNQQDYISLQHAVAPAKPFLA